MSEYDRYWCMDHLSDSNMNDLELCADRLTALVDEEEGGIIGYILPEFSDEIEKKLNKTPADVVKESLLGEDGVFAQ